MPVTQKPLAPVRPPVITKRDVVRIRNAQASRRRKAAGNGRFTPKAS